MVEAVVAGRSAAPRPWRACSGRCWCDERGRQVLRIVVDGEAEQHQLHQRHAEHHGEGDAVAPHLDEFLHQQRAEPGEGEDRVHSMLSFDAGHELDEDVLQAGLARRDRDALAPAEVLERCFEQRPGPSRRRAASCRRARPARRPACLRARLRPRSSRGPSTTKVVSPAFGDDLVDRAAGQQLAVGDVADAVAALGLVHVVGGDQHGQPVARQPVDLVPEFAPRLGVDAGRRLVEQQQLRLVHDAGGERQPLLPAAGQRAGELVAPRRQAKLLERAVDMLGDRLQLVEPRHEFQVLGDRQILVERELLRHVADFALDLQALGPDIVAEHRALALVGRQQAAQHADGRRLARAVRAEEADDLALGDRHRDMVDDGLVAEALDQSAETVDGVHGVILGACRAASTSTICPGCSAWRRRPAAPRRDRRASGGSRASRSPAG